MNGLLLRAQKEAQQITVIHNLLKMFGEHFETRRAPFVFLKNQKYMEGLLWTDLCNIDVAKSVPNLREIINEEDDFTHYALETALDIDCFETFCYFVDCGANVYKKNICGEPLLNAAVRKNWFKCVKKLLDAGVWVDCKDDERLTPLHEAVWMADDPNITLLLLAHGANVNAISNENMTPLDYAFDAAHGPRHSDPKKSPHIKSLILMGAKINDLPSREYIPPLWRDYIEKLSACKSASIALRIALRKHRVSKDIVPLIEALVFKTRENDEWKN